MTDDDRIIRALVTRIEDLERRLDAQRGDPDQPRDESGKWTSGGVAGPRTVDSIETFDDLKRFSSSELPADTEKTEYFYHSPRSDAETRAVGESGLKPGQAGVTWLSKDEIRDRGGGYVVVAVPRGVAVEGVDRVEEGVTYREWTVDREIPADSVVKVVGVVPLGEGGHSIREDELAQFAVENQGSKEAADLPDRYQAWFSLEGKKFYHGRVSGTTATPLPRRFPWSSRHPDWPGLRISQPLVTTRRP
jgi:hypothetical protein